MTNEPSPLALAKSMKAEFRDRLNTIDAALERDAKSLSLVSHAWIVSVQGVVMEFTFRPVAGGKRESTGVKAYADCLTTPRFSKEDAATLAADVRNGNDVAGVAMHWTDAAERERQSLLESIAHMDKAIARHT